MVIDDIKKLMNVIMDEDMSGGLLLRYLQDQMNASFVTGWVQLIKDGAEDDIFKNRSFSKKEINEMDFYITQMVTSQVNLIGPIMRYYESNEESLEKEILEKLYLLELNIIALCNKINVCAPYKLDFKTKGEKKDE